MENFVLIVEEWNYFVYFGVVSTETTVDRAV
jgi:hypothetical protein